jgi:polysaccharide chain length determinant protein (PEP-CTERM system associated)
MIGPATSLGDLIQLLMKEGKRRLVLLAALFSLVAIVALGVGLSLPKKWDASATLLVEESNVIKPLLEGRAFQQSLADQTSVVTQVVMSKKILREILAFGGWIRPSPAPQPDPRQEEQLLTKLKGRIHIDSPRDGLIRLSYNDSDQQRSYKIANRIAEIYVREATESKERESREAFDFIDGQVKEYGQKLIESHEKVLAYYRGEETPQAPAPDPERPAPPRPKASSAGGSELAQLRAEEATLSAQLGKAAPPRLSPAETRQAEERARARVVDLQAQLDRMLVSYTDEHPDVRRLKRELAAAQEEMARAEQAGNERRTAADAASALDDQVAAAARLRLEAVRKRIAQLTGKPVVHHHSTAAVSVSAAERVDPELRGVGTNIKLSELLRQYESTRDIYQDLLKRRENARVSMVLDAERRGLTLRIQEAAEMPITPSSLRLMHLTLIGLVFAALVPIGILFAIVSLDRRVRSPIQIEKIAKVPLLVSIGYTPEKRELVRLRSRGFLVLLMMACVFAVYAAAFIIKMRSS